MSRRIKAKPNRPGQFESVFANRFSKPSTSIGPIIDAEFETVQCQTKSCASKLPGNPSATFAPVAETAHVKFDEQKTRNDKNGMSVFSRKPAKPASDDRIAFYGFGAVLVALSFWVSGGHSLFGRIDSITTSGIPSPVSTEIADASWRVVTADGKTALHVEGIVRNAGKVAMHTKPVTVTVKHNNGSTKRYLLGQKGWTLGPGQEVVVSGRLDIGFASVASVAITLSN